MGKLNSGLSDAKEESDGLISAKRKKKRIKL